MLLAGAIPDFVHVQFGAGRVRRRPGDRNVGDVEPQSASSERGDKRCSPRPCARPIPKSPRRSRLELGRQRDEIELIASENIVSRAVLEAQGSVLTNKYAEGLPGKRYYGGCQFVDIAERLAIERVTKLFGCKFANVQPHSGASANAEVFFALMQPGDTFMGLNLAAGGHLTHGSPVNMSGKWFKPVPYDVRRDDQRIDMERGRAARARAQAEADHRRRLGLSAHHRFPRLPRDLRRGRRLSDGRHGAFRRPGRRRRASFAVPARACRDHDDAQDAARPARRRDPVRRRGDGEEAQLGGVPRHAGRAADACDRRQGGGLRRGAAAELQAPMRATWWRTPRRWPRR